MPVLAHALTPAVDGVDEPVADGDGVSGRRSRSARCARRATAATTSRSSSTARTASPPTASSRARSAARARRPTGYADQVALDHGRLLALPPETRVHPGHARPTTIGDEWESNPFIRVWRGVDPEGDEPCRCAARPATLILWGPDYDGTHKAWVRFADGRDAIVGGSAVER